MKTRVGGNKAVSKQRRWHRGQFMWKLSDCLNICVYMYSGVCMWYLHMYVCLKIFVLSCSI